MPRSPPNCTPADGTDRPEAGWRSIQGAGALVAGAGLFATFLLVERRDGDVLMPPHLFRHRGLVAAIVLVAGFMTGINFLHYSFFIQLQDVLTLDAFRAGLAFVPVSVGDMLGSVKILPAPLDHGLRVALLVGILGLGLSMAALAPAMTPHGSYLTMLPSTLLWSASAGIAFVLLAVASRGIIAAGEATPVVGDVVAGLRTGLWMGAGMVSITAFVALLVPGTRPGAVSEATPAGGIPARDG